MFEIKDNMTDKSFNKHVVKLKKHTTNNSKRDISTLIKRTMDEYILWFNITMNNGWRGLVKISDAF